MKKKLANKAITLATTGIVTATSVTNPLLISAEGLEVKDLPDTNEESQGITNENITGNQKDENINSGTDMGNNESQNRPVELSDIGVIGKLSGNKVKIGGKYYSNDARLNITATSLREDVTVSKVLVCVNNTTLLEFNDGSGEFDLPSFTGNLMLKYEISDGTVLEQKAGDVIPEFNSITNFTIDTNKPKFTKSFFDGEEKIVNGKSYYVSDGSISVSFKDVDSGVGIDTNSWVVEGVERFEYSEDRESIIINTKDLPEGVSELSVSVSDYLGNVSDVYSETINMYRTAPAVTANKISGIYVTSKDKTYKLPEEKISVQLQGYNDNRITKIELFNGLELVSEVVNGNFEITENGDYNIKVTDVVNQENVISLKDLTDGELCTITTDTTSPELLEFNTDCTSGESKELGTVYTSEGTFKFKFSDTESGIDLNSLSLEGLDYTINMETNEIEVSSKVLNEGLNVVKYKISDKLGNTLEGTKDIYMMRKEASIVGISHGDILTVEGGSFFNKDIDFNLEKQNIESIKKVVLVKDNKEIKDIDTSFTVSESGNYLVRVYDKLGISKDFHLSDLYDDLYSDNLIIDTDCPEFKDLHKFTGESVVIGNKTYFTTDGDIILELKDVGCGVDVSKLKVTGNSGKVLEYVYDENSFELKINTSQLEDGDSNISIVSTDKLGNNMKDVSLSIVLHRKFPEISGLTHSDVVVDNGKTYFNKMVNIAIGGYDNKNITKIELIKDNKVLYEIKNGMFSISESGNYSVKVYDIVGNLKEYKLEELFKNNSISSNMLLDNVAPVVESKEFNGDKVVIGDKTYYTSNGNIKIKFKDDGIGVNAGGIKVKGINNKYVSVLKDENGIEIDTNGFKEGKNEITVSVSDVLENNITISLTYYFHRVFPEISGNTHEPVYVENNKTYIKEETNFSLKDLVKDKIKKLELVKDGSVLSEISDGKFSISESGTYTIRLTDIIGTTKEYKLEDLYIDCFSSVMLDTKGPNYEKTDFTGNIVTVEDTDYYTTNGEIRISFIDSLSGINIDSISVSNLSKQDYNVNEKGIVINTSKLKEGKTDFSVLLTDNLGNSSFKDFSVFMHREFPIITGSSHDEVLVKDDKTYITDSIKVGLNGINSYKVKNVELFKDGKKLSNIEKGAFEIKDTGVYTIKVTDIINTIKEYKLEDLFKDITSDVYLDVEAPKFKNYEFTGSQVTVDNKVYYTSDGDITVHCEDALSGIDVDSWKVSGVNSFSISKDGSFIRINSKDLKECTNNLSVEVSDCVGNTDKYNLSVYMFRYAPEINGVKHSKVENKNSTSYVNKTLSVTLGGTTNEKIKRIELIKNGNVIDEIDKEGKFSLSESGEYTIRVVDLVDNANVYRLEDLFSDLCSNIVIDNENPVANITINGEEVNTDKWVTEEGKLLVSLSDDAGLKSSVVTVNGKKFKNNYDISKSEEVEIDLFKDISRPVNGKYKISVKVEDITGNETIVDTKTISADFDKPEFKDLVAFGVYMEDTEDNVVYFKGNLNIVGSAEDIGSGIKSVELLKDGKVVSNGLPAVIENTGNYMLRAIDNAGLVTVIQLSKVLGTNSNKLISDNIAPNVEKVEGFKPDLVENGKNWYKKAPTFTYNVTDDNMRSVSIKVNGDEKVDGLNENDNYIVHTEGYEGKVDVVIEATDKIGNTFRDTYTYYSDFTSPDDISVFIDKNCTYKDGKMFFKEIPSITVSAKDDGIGISEYRIVGDKEESNTTGIFELGTGEYSVKVLDKLGNTSEVLKLSELLGYESNEFVVDSFAPKASISRTDSLYGNWYNGNIDFNISLSDNVGLANALIYINGKEVGSYSSSKWNDTLGSVVVNTGSVEESSNGLYEVKVIVYDNAGNSFESSDTIYIDKTYPTVDKFIFNGSGRMEGANTGGTDKYGFFFDGSASCDIYVSDGKVSSGVKNVTVEIEDTTGNVEERVLSVNGGIARLDLPDGFKGFISAYAEDNVGNIGSSNRPDGIVSENSNWHNNSVALSITLPDTLYRDINGNPLYNIDTNASAVMGCNISGIRDAKWGIDRETLGEILVNDDGTISGDIGSVLSSDRNLVLSLSKNIPMKGNANSMSLWLNVVDRVGHSSDIVKNFSIDKDAPEISVSYDKNIEDSCYNSNRTATITVKERNFDPSQFKVEGVYGSLGNWSNSGDIWTNTMSFTEDNEYKFSLSCVDRAGNSSNVYSSESFIIDKTAPIMRVSWNIDKPINDNYYNIHRTATVTVIERNFDSNLFKLEGSGSLGNWSNSGDTHTAVINFSDDGEYEFSISGADKAGNTCESYNSGKFNIDATMPKLIVEGVENSVSYKEDVGFTVKMSDTNIDINNTSVILTGRKQGNIRVNGVVNDKTGEYTFKDIPKEEIYDDIYTLSAKVTDKAGNVTNEDIMFSVNRFGSKYEFMDASILGTYLNKPQDIVINEVNVDKLDTSKAKVSVIKDGVEVNVDESLISIEESGGKTDKYNYKYTVNAEAFKEDGKYLVQVYSHAIEGSDYSSVSEEYAFVLDTKKPEIIISGVSSKEKYKDYEKTVTIDVRDKTGIQDIKAILNGKNVPLSKKNGVYSFIVKESNNLQNIEVSVIDMAGNKSKKIVEDFLVSSDNMIFILNQWWFKWGIGALITFLGVIIALIAKSRHDKHKEEKESAREYAEMYNTTASKLTQCSGSSTGKDLVGELDVTEDAETELLDESGNVEE